MFLYMHDRFLRAKGPMTYRKDGFIFMKKLLSLLLHPDKLLFSMGMHGWIRFLKDETYLKLMYWCRFHRKLDLKNPRTFNEKLQWLKLHDRKPEYTQMVDKYLVKQYVAERIGEEYIIPTLGVWDKFDEIDFNFLPDQFVLKCTHDSGGLVICRDKSKLDIPAAREKIEKCLKRNYYYTGREWPYKNVPPRIIAEKMMVDDSCTELKDYKVMCFGGIPKLIQVHSGRFDYHTQDYYDAEWNHLDIYQGCPLAEKLMDKPAFLEEMLALSAKLSADCVHVRVDWYYTNDQLYFGELTYYDASGFDAFEPEKYDDLLGTWVDLSIL